MATQILESPVSTYYTVDFRTGGDTTKEAFHKHIQEITRIYGYLKALDAGKLSENDTGSLNSQIGNMSTQLQNHINSTNPHPNWKPSISWSDLASKPKLSDLEGDLDAGRVAGNLYRATIPAASVTKLKEKIEEVVGSLSSGGSSEGITEGTVAANGYVKFGNGLMIQWGTAAGFSYGATSGSVTFPSSFSEACYTATISPNASGVTAAYLPKAAVSGMSKTGLTFLCDVPSLPSSPAGSSLTWSVRYIAIGK